MRLGEERVEKALVARENWNWIAREVVSRNGSFISGVWVYVLCDCLVDEFYDPSTVCS